MLAIPVAEQEEAGEALEADDGGMLIPEGTQPYVSTHDIAPPQSAGGGGHPGRGEAKAADGTSAAGVDAVEGPGDRGAPAAPGAPPASSLLASPGPVLPGPVSPAPLPRERTSIGMSVPSSSKALAAAALAAPSRAAKRSSFIPPPPAPRPPSPGGVRAEAGRDPSPEPRLSSLPPPRPAKTIAPPPDDRLSRLENQTNLARGLISRQGSDLVALRARIERRVKELESRVSGISRPPDGLEARIADLETLAVKVRAGDAALRQILDQQKQRQKDRQDLLANVAARVEALEAVGLLVPGTQVLSAEATLGDAPSLVDRLAAVERGAIQIEARLARMEARLATLADSPHGATAASRDSLDSDPATTTLDGVEGLKRIHGIGPKFAKALVASGVVAVAEIAAWTDADIEVAAAQIGTTVERIRKAGWVASARQLVDAAGSAGAARAHEQS